MSQQIFNWKKEIVLGIMNGYFWASKIFGEIRRKSWIKNRKNPVEWEIEWDNVSSALDRSSSRTKHVSARFFLSPAPSGYKGRSQASPKATPARAGLFLWKLNLVFLSEGFSKCAHFTGGRQLSARTASYSSALTTGPPMKQPETKKTSTLRLKSPSAAYKTKNYLQKYLSKHVVDETWRN